FPSRAAGWGGSVSVSEEGVTAAAASDSVCGMAPHTGQVLRGSWPGTASPLSDCQWWPWGQVRTTDMNHLPEGALRSPAILAHSSGQSSDQSDFGPFGASRFIVQEKQEGRADRGCEMPTL